MSLNENLILYDFILDKIKHSANCVVSINLKEFYEQSEIRLKNDCLIRFNQIESQAFTKFINLKSLSLKFRTRNRTAHDETFNQEEESDIIEYSLSKDLKQSLKLSNAANICIENVNKRFFQFHANSNLANVEELTLGFNTIRKLDTCSFSQFDNLKKLDLSGNKIKEIYSAKIFKGL